jgi:hypothetical protein
VADSPYRPSPTQFVSTGDPVFEAYWTRVDVEWDDADAHVKMLEYAIASSALPELAARYAKYKENITRAEFAAKRVTAITLAAVSMLEATRSPKYQRPPWPIVASAAFIFVCALIFVWATLSR